MMELKRDGNEREKILMEKMERDGRGLSTKEDGGDKLKRQVQRSEREDCGDGTEVGQK